MNSAETLAVQARAVEPLAGRIAADLAAADAVVAVPVTTLWSNPEAPRPIDADAVRPHPDLAAWASALATERGHVTGLHGRILTQALLGEPVQIRAQREGFVSVVCPWQPSSLDADGYPGWVPESHLAAVPHLESGATWSVVTWRQLGARTEARRGAFGGTLSYGTIVAATEAVERCVRVEVGGSVLFVPDGGLASLSSSPPAAGGMALWCEARRFLGLGYLWGGMSGAGIDCSGLVHLVHRRLGLRLARDADDQAGWGSAVSVGEALPGDLALFARPGATIHHVGIVAPRVGGVTSPQRMLHAPMSGRVVGHVSLALEPYLEQLVALRRTISPIGPTRLLHAERATSDPEDPARGR